MANYGGMPSDVQAIMAKKKKATTPVVFNSTTLNTPQAVQDAMAAKATAPVAPVATPTLPTMGLQSPTPASSSIAAAKPAASVSVPLPGMTQSAQDLANKMAGVTPVSNTPQTTGIGGMPSAIQSRIATPALPNQTAVQNPLDILSNTAMGRQQAAVADKQFRNAASPTGGTPSGGGSGSGGSGGSGGGGGSAGSIVYGSDGLGSIIQPEVPGTNTGSNAGSTGTDAETNANPVPEQNAYFADVVNSKFEYNPATDQGYMQAAAQAENAIIQSIIGRGGLYSSVAQSAVATKLADLSITYQEAAYKKYTDERSFKMQIAQFEQDRINTAWEQDYKLDQRQIDLEQKKFENQMNLAQFQFTQEKEAFDRSMTIAAAQRAAQSSYTSGASSSAKAATAAQSASLQTKLLANQTARTQLANITKDWSDNGGAATKAVANYFSAYGVQVGSQMSDFQDVISGMRSNLDNEIYTINAGLTDVADQKLTSQFMDDYLNASKNNAPSVATKAGTSAESSTSAMQSTYYTMMSQATNGGKSGINNAINTLASNSGTYKARLGSYYYDLLLSNLVKAKNASTNTSSGFGI
jgi:hypothetical protein